MAHQIEQFSDGTAAFFSARRDAWHQLGTVTTGCLAATDVLRVAYLGGWDVRKEILQAVASGAIVTDRYATTRQHPKTGEREALGVVGKNYKVVQNEQVCDLLDCIVDETGAHHETAGSLRGGREVFVTMKLPTSMRIAGIDDMDLYLAVCTSHDGSRATRILATPVRIVCANTQAAAFRNNVGEYALRHSGDISGKLAEIRAALKLVPVYLDQFQAEAEKMIEQQLEWEQLQRIAAHLWPADDDTTAATDKRNSRDDDLRHLFTQAPTQAGIHGTAWAGYQAIVEWLDHHQPAKSDLHRANRVLTDSTITRTKRRAFDLLSAR
ncbi:DUF932 domain-containing protein [Actinoplanes sp. DH11]|uniref:DUF932 domain-containing protein n=1 Tax=Actinoplanes sp. DH11 TaxID=2857011 RepID=UPI001E3B3334|nr:DUF932 domain-containing protein [Actinoplanes sp. DH11]